MLERDWMFFSFQHGRKCVLLLLISFVINMFNMGQGNL